MTELRWVSKTDHDAARAYLQDAPMPSQVGVQALLAGRAGLAMEAKQDATLEHLRHTFTCDQCWEDSAKLRKKLKKWKKRAKLRGYMRPAIRKSDRISESGIAERDER